MAPKDLLQQLHLVVEDLAALDGSLTSLFEAAPNTDVTEHQQLVQVGSFLYAPMTASWAWPVFSTLSGRSIICVSIRLGNAA